MSKRTDRRLAHRAARFERKVEPTQEIRIIKITQDIGVAWPEPSCDDFSVSHWPPGPVKTLVFPGKGRR